MTSISISLETMLEAAFNAGAAPATPASSKAERKAIVRERRAAERAAHAKRIAPVVAATPVVDVVSVVEGQAIADIAPVSAAPVAKVAACVNKNRHSHKSTKAILAKVEEKRFARKLTSKAKKVTLRRAAQGAPKAATVVAKAVTSAPISTPKTATTVIAPVVAKVSQGKSSIGAALREGITIEKRRNGCDFITIDYSAFTFKQYSCEEVKKTLLNLCDKVWGQRKNCLKELDMANGMVKDMPEGSMNISGTYFHFEEMMKRNILDISPKHNDYTYDVVYKGDKYTVELRFDKDKNEQYGVMYFEKWIHSNIVLNGVEYCIVINSLEGITGYIYEKKQTGGYDDKYSIYIENATIQDNGEDHRNLTVDLVQQIKEAISSEINGKSNFRLIPQLHGKSKSSATVTNDSGAVFISEEQPLPQVESDVVKADNIIEIPKEETKMKTKVLIPTDACKERELFYRREPQHYSNTFKLIVGSKEQKMEATSRLNRLTELDRTVHTNIGKGYIYEMDHDGKTVTTTLKDRVDLDHITLDMSQHKMKKIGTPDRTIIGSAYIYQAHGCLVIDNTVTDNEKPYKEFWAPVRTTNGLIAVNLMSYELKCALVTDILARGAVWYDTEIESASEIKADHLALVKGSWEERINNNVLRLEERLNIASYGAHNIHQAEMMDKELEVGQVFKPISRYGLGKTGTTDLGQLIHSMVIYVGEVKFFSKKEKEIIAALEKMIDAATNNTVKETLKKKLANKIAHGIGNVLADGHYFKNGSRLTATIKGMIAQERLAMSIKGADIVFDEKLFVEVVQSVMQIMHADITKIADEDMNGVNFKKKYAGKMVLVGCDKIEDADIFVEMTTLKTVFDFNNLKAGIPLLTMATPKAFRSTTVTSMQYFRGFGDVAENIVQRIVELGKKTIDKIVDGSEEDTEITKISQILNGIYSLPTIDLSIIKSDPIRLRDWMMQVKTRMEDIINKIRLEVAGCYGLLSIDIATLFGVKVLRDNEIYVNNKKLIGKKVDMIRFPHTDKAEHIIVLCVGLETIVQRIEELRDAGELTAVQADLIAAYYRHIVSGVVVVQNASKAIARLLGGSDYDGDGVMLIADEQIVAWASKISNRPMEYGASRKNTNKKVWSYRLRDELRLAQLKNQNDSIGRIDNRTMTFVAMADVLPKMPKEVFDRIIKNLSNVTYYAHGKQVKISAYLHANQKYQEGFFERYTQNNAPDSEYIIMDEAALDALDEEIKRCGIASKKNMRAVLRDVCKANSSSGGRVIDASKDNGIVKTLLGFMDSVVRAGALSPITLNYDKEAKCVSLVEKEYIGTFEQFEDERVDKYHTYDFCYQIKQGLAKYAAERMNAVIAECDTEILPENTAFNQDVINATINLKKLYSILSSANHSKECRFYVKGMFRKLTETMTDEERYNLALHLSTSIVTNAKTGEDEFVRSHFYAMFDEVLIAKCHDTVVSADLYRTRESNTTSIELGEMIEFVNGYNKELGLYTVEKINGKFPVGEIDGKACVGTTIHNYAAKLSAVTEERPFAFQLAIEKNCFEGANHNVLATFNGMGDTIKNAIARGDKFVIRRRNIGQGSSYVLAIVKANRLIDICPLIVRGNSSIIEKYINQKEIDIKHVEAFDYKFFNDDEDNDSRQQVSIYGYITGDSMYASADQKQEPIDAIVSEAYAAYVEGKAYSIKAMNADYIHTKGFSFEGYEFKTIEAAIVARMSTDFENNAVILKDADAVEAKAFVATLKELDEVRKDWNEHSAQVIKAVFRAAVTAQVVKTYKSVNTRLVNNIVAC